MMARVTRGSGGGGRQGGGRGPGGGNGWAAEGRAAGRRLCGGGLTARKTVSNKQPTMMLGTEMTTAKVRDRTVSTTGHSVRMSKQSLVWRRGEEHS